MITLKSITMHYRAGGGVVQVLAGADFSLRRGEIHALAGDNGAGKSTLFRILAGLLRPDSGVIEVDGRRFPRAARARPGFASPREALRAGLGMAAQNPLIPAGLKVWEYCTLSAPGAGPLLQPRQALAAVEEAAARWGLALPLSADAVTLNAAARQKAAILALLLSGASCLLLDEPTAVLSDDETRALFATLRALRDAGRGIAIVSHKQDEVMALADRVTVLERGKTRPLAACSTLNNSMKNSRDFTLSEAALSNSAKRYELLERERAEKKRVSPPPLPPKKTGKPLLRCRGLVSNWGIDLYAGDIVRVSGPRGEFLDPLERSLAGLEAPPAGASVIINGIETAGKGPRAFRGAGGAYLPAGTAAAAGGGLPLSESLIIHVYHRRGAFFLDIPFLEAWAQNIVARAGFSRSASEPVSAFSGGMLRRILLARELAGEARLVILSEPEAGLDAPSREQFARDLRDWTRQGKAALVFKTAGSAAETSAYS